MRLPEQMRRAPKFDIRSCVHTGIDFDLNGHFSPLFDGIVYLMIPQWANVSSIDDLTKVKMNISGQEIDFSHLDLSRLDQSKLNSHWNKKEQSKIQSEESIKTSNESKSWFHRWFSSDSTPSLPPTPSATTPNAPVTRKSCSCLLEHHGCIPVSFR